MLWRHALPNAIVPTIQVIALQLAWLAGGIVIVEYLFGYPGIGSAPGRRGRPTATCRWCRRSCLLIAAVYVILNLIADILTILISPRLQDGTAMSDADATPDALDSPTVVRPTGARGEPSRGVGRRRCIDAWHIGRTKIGVAIFIAIVARSRSSGPRGAPTRRPSSSATPSPAVGASAWLGTDYIGRDVLTRVLYGGRTVISLALAATVIGSSLGVSLGHDRRLRAALASTRRSCACSTSLLAFPPIVLALLLRLASSAPSSG